MTNASPYAKVDILVFNIEVNIMSQEKKEKLIIFDTTLRDGEQCPGASMSVAEKVSVAQALDDMRIDVIEAGFPAASQEDLFAVQQVSKKIDHAVIAVLTRCTDGDIQASAAALKYAKKPRMHLFISTSKIHRQHKLNMTQSQVLDTAIQSVRRAKQFCHDIQFCFEDAFRTEYEFLTESINALVSEGVKIFNLPDTVGYASPLEYGALFQHVYNSNAYRDDIILSAHCHNDLGLAVANSLSAIKNGARQVECTINGIGERAGNTSLEEVVMNIKTRADLYPVEVQVDTKKILTTSRLVSQITHFPVPPNKAIVGINAFAHEAGIHQDGILKNPGTYEIIDPASVGWVSRRFVLGRHSGWAAIKARLTQLGYDLAGREQMQAIVQAFQDLVISKPIIEDSDLHHMMHNIYKK